MKIKVAQRQTELEKAADIVAWLKLGRNKRKWQDTPRCQAMTRDGGRCQRNANYPNEMSQRWCLRHWKMLKQLEREGV